MKKSKQLQKKIKFLKYLTYLLRFFGGDMSYPPVLTWRKKITLEIIKNSWKSLAEEITSGYQKLDKVGIYLHIPFCPSKCFYCNCISFPQLKESQHKIYLDCLEKEVKLLNFPKQIKIRTLYIGGGTPSILSEQHLERLFEFLHKSFNFSECEQKMIEISPYTISFPKFKILKNFGINKITIGVQTLDESLLKRLNRPQEKRKVIEAFYMGRNVGIKYINIDLMVGLPGQTIKSFITTLEEILKLKPDTIHLNPFFPTSFTPFSLTGHRLKEEDIKLRTKMLEIGRQLIFAKYPYAIERDELEKENLQLFNSSKFNSSVLGLGWGALSHVRSHLHYLKYPNFKKYLEHLQKNKFPIVFGYFLNVEDEMRANIINALEREQKVDREIFKLLFSKDPLEVFKKEFSILAELNKITINKNTIEMNVQNRIEPFIFSKFFYEEKVINKLKKIVKIPKRFHKLDFKLACFYEL
jgi:oxygen-independent coproporphyrinogen-3 oxidase